MEYSSIIKLVCYVVPVLFLLVGFLLGMWKGAKKAGARLLVFFVFVVLTFLFSQLITKAIVNITITVDGTQLTLAQYLRDAILQIEKVSYFYNLSESFAQIIDNMPIAIANLAVFVVLLYVFSFIGWIVYLILAAIFFKENRKPYIIKDGRAQIVSDYAKPKKYRWLGGFIGAVQAFILVFLTFMPITAATTTLGGYVNSTSNNIVYAQSEEQDYTPTSQMLRESIPEELIDIVNVYNSTATSKIYSAVGLDKVCFDILTTVKVGNEKIVLRKELNNFANIYDNVEFLLNFDLKKDKLKDINFDQLEKGLNYLFDSGFVKSMLPDAVELILTDMVSENPQLNIQLPEQYTRYVNALYDEVCSGDKKDIGYYKSEIFAVFGIVKSIAKSGIADELLQEKIDVDKIIELINADNRLVITNTTNNLFESKFVKVFLVEGINSLLEKADEYDKDVNVPLIDKSLVNWSQVKVNFASVLNSVVDICVNFEDNVDGSIQDLKSKPQLLLNLDINLLTSRLASIMNKVQNSALLVSANGGSIYNSLIDIFENSSYSGWVDLTTFKQAGHWDVELNYLNSALNAVKNSGLSTALTGTIDAEVIIDDLAKIDTVTGKTYIRQIVEPLLNSNAFERAITNYGFNYINNFISTYQNKIGDDVVLGKIQSEKLSQPNQKELIVAFFENIIVYAQDLDLQQLKSDAFSTIVSSNLASLGNALDNIRESALFGPYEEENGDENKGIYVNLIEGLANNDSIAAFSDFESALSEGFTWNGELSLLQDAITILNGIKINVGETEKSVINAIKDGDDLTLIFENLSTENDDIDNIVSSLSQSKLMKKTLVVIVNTLNSKLSEVLLLAPAIGDISDDSDLYSQRESISTTLKDVVDVYNVIKDGLDETKLKNNSAVIGKLLNTLMASKNSGGIFAGTYDGFRTYLSTTQYAEKINYLLAEYTNQSDIDWIQILDLAVEAQSYSGGEISSGLSTKISNLVGTVYADEDYTEITSTLIDIANALLILDADTDKITALETMIDAFESLEQFDGKQAKVDKTCEFIAHLTGVDYLDNVKSISDYSAQKQSLSNLKDKVTLIDNNTATIDDAKSIVDILAESDIVLDVFEDNGLTISVADEIKTELSTYVNDNVSDANIASIIKNILTLE